MQTAAIISYSKNGQVANINSNGEGTNILPQSNHQKANINSNGNGDNTVIQNSPQTANIENYHRYGDEQGNKYDHNDYSHHGSHHKSHYHHRHYGLLYDDDDDYYCGYVWDDDAHCWVCIDCDNYDCPCYASRTTIALQ